MGKSPKQIIGHRLWVAREETDLRQKDVAETLRISESAISRIELGNRYPSLPVFIELCEVYNVSADDMLWGED